MNVEALARASTGRRLQVGLRSTAALAVSERADRHWMRRQCRRRRPPFHALYNVAGNLSLCPLVGLGLLIAHDHLPYTCEQHPQARTCRLLSQFDKRGSLQSGRWCGVGGWRPPPQPWAASATFQILRLRPLAADCIWESSPSPQARCSRATTYVAGHLSAVDLN